MIVLRETIDGRVVWDTRQVWLSKSGRHIKKDTYGCILGTYPCSQLERLFYL